MGDTTTKTTMPWGISSQKLQPGSMKTITDSKLATFAVGQQKKSRFQKAREEKEQKKKEEEEAAAKLFETFVASFTEDDDSKTFVRGGKVNADGEVLGGKAGDIYKMDRRAGGPMSEMERMMLEMQVSPPNRKPESTLENLDHTESGHQRQLKLKWSSCLSLWWEIRQLRQTSRWEEERRQANRRLP